MKTLLSLVITALLAVSIVAAQTADALKPDTPKPDEPRYLLTIGAGFSQYTDPHITQTGTVGIRIAEGLYSTTSLDLATKLDAGKRVSLSTIRTGAQRVIARQGPATLAAAGDVGLAVGGDNLAGAFSGGGTLVYSLPPKWGPLFLFGNVRIIKSPQNEAANPATVQTAFTFGVGYSFK